MILGIDPSLNGTGICRLKSDLSVSFIKVNNPSGGPTGPKLARLYHKLEKITNAADIKLCIIEGASFGSTSKKFLLGQATGVCLLQTQLKSIPTLIVPPRTLKSAVAGSGNATKDQVKESVGTALGLTNLRDTDLSDAAALAILGAHIANYLGYEFNEELATTRKLLEVCKNVTEDKKNKPVLTSLRREWKQSC